jgi:hypothetical protein
MILFPGHSRRFRDAHAWANETMLIPLILSSKFSYSRDYARRPRKSVMASEVMASKMTPMP